MADENFEITRIAEPMVYPDQNRVDVNFTVFVRDLSTNEIQSLLNHIQCDISLCRK